MPVGAHASLAGGDTGTITLSGMMGSEDGRMVLRHTASGDDPEKLGRSVARYLVDEAGGSSLGIIGDQ